MENERILDICRRLNENSDTETTDIIKFKEKYPKLYQYVRTETYDEDFLRLLLTHKENSRNDVLGTDMKVAECIADKYLYNNNVLKRPNEREMQHYRDKIRRTYS